MSIKQCMELITMPINLINTSQFFSTQINADQSQSKAWSGIDQHWEKLRSIDRHWSDTLDHCQKFDPALIDIGHWSTVSWYMLSVKMLSKYSSSVPDWSTVYLSQKEIVKYHSQMLTRLYSSNLFCSVFSWPRVQLFGQQCCHVQLCSCFMLVDGTSAGESGCKWYLGACFTWPIT